MKPVKKNQKGFAKDGQPLAGEEALKAALCTDWLDEIRASKFTTPYPPFNPTKDPMGNCPEDPDFWFIEGVDQKTEEQFKSVLCDSWIDNKQKNNYTNSPLDRPATTDACGNQEFWFFQELLIDSSSYSAVSAHFQELLISRSSCFAGACDFQELLISRTC